CQACGIQGHSAKNCPDFLIVRDGATTPQWQQQGPMHNWQQQAQMQNWNPRTNVAMMQGDASTRLLDSGASHHMTSDIANLSLHNPYNGGNDVILGDGSGLSISHT
uniref:CCHC-type domain-containing protein n=1 Tax=Brassica oleracea var. oleracea TaxID=109376 RepID=A0A0D3AGH2_BRAOL